MDKITGMRQPTLSDYALIGNCCSAALVSKHGSIDWCCLPEFHSPSVFAALLDRDKGGHFSIAPSVNYFSKQRYIPDTNVLETEFTTTSGTVKLIDAFTAMKEEEKVSSLHPDLEILRVVEGVSGTVSMKLDFSPRILYGKKLPDLRDQRKLGIKVCWKENILVLLSTLEPGEFTIDKDRAKAVAEFCVKPGQKVIFSLSYSGQSPAVVPELKETGWRRMSRTIAYWKTWIARCQYNGIYREQVRRSALTLKLLEHAPSGAIIAAPTTSLPETIQGERNWDYRFCWLRDASFTARVLIKLGFEEEAHAYMNWIIHATRLTRPRLQVVYSVYGHSSLREKTLDWLRGYKDSRPVRIGNKADAQFQLDVYGEVLDAVYSYAPFVKDFDLSSRNFILGLGEVICKTWDQPDRGIWEIRASDVHHTHSKVMAWVGLDRLTKLINKYHWPDAPVQKFKETAILIRNQIEEYGYNPKLNAYTRELGGTNLDASLLTLSLVGYCNYTSPKMMSTVKMIHDQLSENNLVYRYRNVNDGLGEPEGTFSVCNFWLAENFARSGRVDDAIRIFESMLALASPTGLLSEEIDPGSQELLGNYPQGYTHIGLINAAISIQEVLQEKEQKYEYR